MLHELERKLTALVGDRLAGRPHLRVVQAPTPLLPLAAGRGAVRVGLAEVTPATAFERSQVAFGGTADAPTSRRVLPLRFQAAIEVAFRPGDTASALLDGRALLLEDLSLIAHALAAPDVRDGSAFSAAGPDLGFAVRAFELERGQIGPAPGAEVLGGELRAAGEAIVWPTTPAGPAGTIRRADTVLAPLPIPMDLDRPVVPAGATARLRIGSVPGQRLTGPAGAERGPVALALRVMSDLPPEQRGVILSGAAGPETGLRIVPTTGPETVVEYRAPGGDLGAVRLELVAVHLARPDGEVGPFLGSVAVKLAPAVP